MKPPSFDFFAPTSLGEALRHMAEFSFGAKALAGGQSLIQSSCRP